MADFLTSYKKTVYGNEGGYDPGTNEAETYEGIDRSKNPQWPGWKIIDAYKRDNPGASVKRLNFLFSQNEPLQANIQAFYKENYWNPLGLDHVNDQYIANNLFDCSVNQGEPLSARIMQHACNYVNASFKSPLIMLQVDGIPGAHTLASVNSLPAPALMAEINAEREASYRRDREFADWGKTWLERLVPYPAAA